MHPFLEQLQLRVFLGDGGTGSEFIRHGIPANRCMEYLTFADPGLVQQVHRDYFTAGADFVETNTLGANRPRLAHHELGETTYELNLSAAQLAKKACPQNRFVLGSIGPTGKVIYPDDPDSMAEAIGIYAEQAEALAEGGVDAICIETVTYREEIEAALRAVKEHTRLPTIVSAVFSAKESTIRTLWGLDIPTFVKCAQDFGADAIGANCVESWPDAVKIAESLKSVTKLPIIIQPNAGQPRIVDGKPIYTPNDKIMLESAKHLLEIGANIIGGCCGTTPSDITKLRPLIDRFNQSHQR